MGGATGAVVGALVDIAEGEDARAVVDAMSRAIPPGTAAVVAMVDEPTPALLDRAVASHRAEVLRRPRDEVELTMAEAEAAALAGEEGAGTPVTSGGRPDDAREPTLRRTG